MGACVTMLFSSIALVSAERIQTLIDTQLVVTFERLMGLVQTNSYSASRLMFFVMVHFLKQVAKFSRRSAVFTASNSLVESKFFLQSIEYFPDKHVFKFSLRSATIACCF